MTPEEAVQVWKERFPEFQPPNSRFYPSMAGVAPGEVLFISASVGGMPVHTGVRVIYADDESFTVMTPEGHPESGWNTFSAHADDDGTTVAQIQSLARANDPVYEIGFRIMGATEQERIWTHVLKSLVRPLRRERAGDHGEGLRGPEGTVVGDEEPLAQRGRPVHALHDDRPAALGPPPGLSGERREGTA